jgi:hypothetical protein
MNADIVEPVAHIIGIASQKKQLETSGNTVEPSHIGIVRLGVYQERCMNCMRTSTNTKAVVVMPVNGCVCLGADFGGRQHSPASFRSLAIWQVNDSSIMVTEPCRFRRKAHGLELSLTHDRPYR